MAFSNEYFVSASASGGGAGTEGDPWTLAEAASGASAGSLVNVKAGAYSSSGVTFSNAGSSWLQASTMIVWRGYNSTPGDLDGQGRNSDTSMDTTNFPVLTMTGSFVPSAYSALFNLRITGAVSGILVGSLAISSALVAHCSIDNTAINSNAQALVLDNYCTIHALGRDDLRRNRHGGISFRCFGFRGKSP